MIKAIDKKIVEKISSGQVITDLSSAIKELVENSLDAGCTSVEIGLLEDGLEGFEVTDNGIGMGESELTMIGEAHATSKLTKFEDLEDGQMVSLGFRGEALYSLKNLSRRVTVISKTCQMAHGLQKVLTDKPLSNLQPCASNQGTRIKVEGLFADYAVRLSEWKRDSKKVMAKVLKIVQSLAISFPLVKFKLTNNSSTSKQPQTLLNTSGPGSHVEVLGELFGFPSKFFIPFHHRIGHCEVLGCFAKPEAPRRSTSDRQFFFVNGHPSDQRLIQKALNEEYRMNGINEYAPVVISLKLSSGGCDLNITPDKRTITIFDASTMALELSKLLQSLVFSSRDQSSLSQMRLSSKSQSQSTVEVLSCPPSLSSQLHVEIPSALLEEPVEDSLSIEDFKRMEIIATNTLLYIVDQHAADERFRLELLERTEFENARSQTLVVPKVLNFDQDDLRIIIEQIDDLKSIGFSFDQSQRLITVPSFAGLTLNDEDLFDIIHSIRDNPILKPSLKLCSRVGKTLASKACRSAIMIGAPLSFPQMSTIVKNLAELERPWICAHGRPTIRLLHANCTL